MKDNQSIVVEVQNWTEHSLSEFLSRQGIRITTVFREQSPDRSSVEQILKTSLAFLAKNCGIPGTQIILMLNKADELIFK